MSTDPTICFVEYVLWEPSGDWDAALEHVTARFARATPLDIDDVRGSGELHAQMTRLTSWAADAGVDLDRELGRWFDEHLSMHVRPAPAVTRAVRALAADSPVHLASALPARAAESIARHAGCWRSVSALDGDVRDAATLAELVDRTAAGSVIAGGTTPLPDGLAVASLGALRP